MRPNLSEDVLSLSEFKRNTAAMVRRIRRTKRPMVLTVNGQAALVVQEPSEYEKAADKQERAEILAAIEQSYADAAAGRVRPASEVLESLRAKLPR